MNKILPLLVISLSSVLSACAGYIDLDRLHPSEPLPWGAEGYVSLRGGQCLGPCPGYDVFIFSDGHVIFRGYFHTVMKGTRVTRIPKARYAELLQTLEEKRFFDADRDHGECLTDQVAFQLTAVSHGVARRRLVDSGCESDSRNLWPAIESIPRIARVDRWARYDNLGW
jgi:hypothetical protein